MAGRRGAMRSHVESEHDSLGNLALARKIRETPEFQAGGIEAVDVGALRRKLKAAEPQEEPEQRHLAAIPSGEERQPRSWRREAAKPELPAWATLAQIAAELYDEYAALMKQQGKTPKPDFIFNQRHAFKEVAQKLKHAYPNGIEEREQEYVQIEPETGIKAEETATLPHFQRFYAEAIKREMRRRLNLLPPAV